MTLDEALTQAELGDIDAMVALGNFYSEQSNYNDGSILFQKALPWYDKAANHGHEFSKEAAARLHFLHAYASRKALGSSAVQNDYEKEIERSVTLLQSMKQTNSNLLQEIQEDRAIFCCEMFVELDEVAPDGNYLNKTIEYMLPYAKSYKKKESLQALVMALSMFSVKQLNNLGFLELFITSAIECDDGYEENELYKALYAYIWSTIGSVYLNGISPYPIDDTYAYQCYEKACKYSNQYASTLAQFKKKLFGGYVFRG